MITVFCVVFGWLSLVGLELILIDELVWSKKRKEAEHDRVRDLGARPRVWEQD